MIGNDMDASPEIVTITPNPALDLTWQVDRLSPGESHRVPTGTGRAGGKGLNVARVLTQQRVRAVAVFTSGGPTGVEFETELAASGVPHVVVPVAAATRRSIALVDQASGVATILNERGAGVSDAEAAALFDAARTAARGARVVVISGSLQPGIDADAIAALAGEFIAAGIVTIVDTSGPAMLAAARVGAIVKPNRDELVEATGLTDVDAGIAQLLDLGARTVVCSRGEAGLTVTSRASGTELTVGARLGRTLRGNATGAGDAAVAALAATYAEASVAPDLTVDGLATLARRATAWSASAVLMPLAGELSPDLAALDAEVQLVPTLEA
ncbi:MAG TPA: PfkB family carbohydrate kinase [Candidatus Lumbricidophila sp.]|nr:PfkB family carbohydrate kinase [Candidatus Lumbricidophila sp.]